MGNSMILPVYRLLFDKWIDSTGWEGRGDDTLLILECFDLLDSHTIELCAGDFSFALIAIGVVCGCVENNVYCADAICKSGQNNHNEYDSGMSFEAFPSLLKAGCYV